MSPEQINAFSETERGAILQLVSRVSSSVQAVLGSFVPSCSGVNSWGILAHDPGCTSVKQNSLFNIYHPSYLHANERPYICLI